MTLPDSSISPGKFMLIDAAVPMTSGVGAPLTVLNLTPAMMALPL